MKKRLLWTGMCLVLLVGGFGVGYIVGYTREFWAGMERLRFETAGNVTLRVDVLSRLRTADTDGAIERIEQSMDQGICTLPMRQDYVELPEYAQRSLMLAKLYRTAFPSKASDTAATLAQVPLIPAGHEYCTPAVAKIAEMAHKKRNEPGREGI